MEKEPLCIDTANGTEITVRESLMDADRVYLEMNYMGETHIGDSMSRVQALKLGLELIKLGTHQE